MAQKINFTILVCTESTILQKSIFCALDQLCITLPVQSPYLPILDMYYLYNKH